MSLINDALRRANQEKKAQPPESSDGAQMQPVQSPQRTTSLAFPMLLVFLLGVVLTCAGWFFWKAFSAKSPVVANAPASNSQPNASTLPTGAVPLKQEVSPAPVVQTESKPSPVSTAPDQVEASAPAAVVADIAEAPPAIPALKLQGIFYRISNPTALINGKTVGVGEKVEGARVIQINRQDVSLERDNEKILLELR